MDLFEDEREESLSKLEKETQINRNLIYSNQYERAIQSLGESKECTRLILSSAKKILEHHNGDRYEDLYFIDASTNRCLYRNNYVSEIQKVEPTENMLKMLNNNPNIIALHNHPDSMLPSISDFFACEKRNYKYGLVLCHNGSIYQYKNIGILDDVNIEAAIAIYEKSELSSLLSAQPYEAIKKAHEEHISQLLKSLEDFGIRFREVLHYER